MKKFHKGWGTDLLKTFLVVPFYLSFWFIWNFNSDCFARGTKLRKRSKTDVVKKAISGDLEVKMKSVEFAETSGFMSGFMSKLLHLFWIRTEGEWE